MPSSSPARGASRSTSRPPVTSASRSRSSTPGSASRPRSRRSFSRRSSRPTAAPRASTAPAWACPSAESSRACSAGRSASRATPAREARSRSICRCPTKSRRWRLKTSSVRVRRRARSCRCASTLLLLLLLHVAHQVLHAGAHAPAELLEIEVGLLHLGEHFAFLFLHVVQHVLAEDAESGAEVGIVGAHVLELLDQHLRGLVLDLRLVPHVLVVDPLARRGIEQLLLQRGVHLQVFAHCLHELLLGLGIFTVELLELLQRLLDLVVLLLQQLDRPARLRFALRHVRRPFWVDETARATPVPETASDRLRPAKSIRPPFYSGGKNY